MIQRINLLRSIGAFDYVSPPASLGLERLTLIHAENGRGKTTLAAVLRSLATNDPQPIAERHRLGSQHPPEVVLDCHNPQSTLIFRCGAWNQALPELKIFDDLFVDENVYSGLNVEAQHRQNLHELILGEQGVALIRKRQQLGNRVNHHSSELKHKDNAIPQHLRGGLSVDKFCDLQELPNIDNKIEAANLKLMAARNQEAVQANSFFEPIALPEFDIEAIKQMLLTDLPDLDKAAEAKVQEHVQALGEGGEPWVEEGFRRVATDDDGNCPFCGQALQGLDLIAHYRTYFSDRYARLKHEVADMADRIDRDHANGAHTTFERAVSKARETAQFWADYSDQPEIGIDTTAIALDWQAASDRVAGLLKAKQAAPLERLALDDQTLNALDSYNTHRRRIEQINGRLAASNQAIDQVKKQAEVAETEELQAELARLEATKARFSPEIAPLCEEYIQEKIARDQTETEMKQATKRLEDYRENVFPNLQEGVNKYLRKFNAGFIIDSLEPANIGSGARSTCTYNVVINNESIAVKSASTPPGKPSFRNSLSAGDRNALALALFFSSLDQNSNLADTVVVLDDPISSLDDHRSYTTVQEVRNLSLRARQVIVLSHKKSFLCDIWNHPVGKLCSSLEISQAGAQSTIREWNVSQDAITEHDRRHEILQKYADNQSGDERQVAESIRLYLEGYLRVAFPGIYPPGTLLGKFLNHCCQKVCCSDKVLNEEEIQELREIVEYGNLFHHDPNPAWQNQAINATELLGFVKRTLDFVSPFKA